MNGKPGDHPLTDILIHKLDVYGKEGADLIRRIAAPCSRRELDEWWEREIGFSGDGQLVRRKGQQYLEELMKRAKKSGWETKR
ncbi:MAG TPA: hypothetical protein VI216_10295 [Candidatus Acidoferrales bacterium]